MRIGVQICHRINGDGEIVSVFECLAWVDSTPMLVAMPARTIPVTRRRRSCRSGRSRKTRPIGVW